MTKSGLGPAAVGQRVVVRRILPGETGPTGGPAFTDVLGTCESWGDGSMTVRTEDGTLVVIATVDIVSGKPVPPRPSIRQRVTAREAESHGEPHWPGVLRVPLGEWQLRVEPEPAGRLRKRANSCLAMGDPGMSHAEAAASVEEFYAGYDRPAMVQVETGSEVDDRFAGAGWTHVPGGDALFLLGSLARAQRLLPPPAEEAELAVDGPRAHATTGGAASVTAFGKAALDGDWLGVHDLWVDDDVRRRGLARAVLAALLEWGAEQGATTVWLHVETGNEPAIALYETLGLVEHHACRYLVSPGR